MHEVLKTKNVMDMYMSTEPELLNEVDLLNLKKDKYNHPKYAIKIAVSQCKARRLDELYLELCVTR